MIAIVCACLHSVRCVLLFQAPSCRPHPFQALLLWELGVHCALGHGGWLGVPLHAGGTESLHKQSRDPSALSGVIVCL